MTKEEAIKVFRSYAIWDLMDNFTTDELQEMINAIVSTPSLPSNLDEAAEEQAHSFGYQKEDYEYKELIETFKAGAEWREAQIPKLPDNLDDAAWNYVAKKYGIKESEKIFENEEIAEDFKAGAEWMAGQGVAKEAVIGMATEEISINVSQETLDELDLCPGDNVVVQIRKK